MQQFKIVLSNLWDQMEQGTSSYPGLVLLI